MSLIEQTNTLHEELAGLMAQVAIDPEKINEANDIYAKAWTYL